MAPSRYVTRGVPNVISSKKVGAAEVAATIYQAVGINPKKNYHAGPRPVPLVAEGSKAISTVLA